MKSQFNIFKGILFGALIGAGVALLMAPKSGKELREELSEQYETTRAEVEARAKEARVKLDEGLTRTRADVEEKRVQLVEAVQSLRKPKNDKHLISEIEVTEEPAA